MVKAEKKVLHVRIWNHPTLTQIEILIYMICIPSSALVLKIMATELLSVYLFNPSREPAYGTYKYGSSICLDRGFHWGVG